METRERYLDSFSSGRDGSEKRSISKIEERKIGRKRSGFDESCHGPLGRSRHKSIGEIHEVASPALLSKVSLLVE